MEPLRSLPDRIGLLGDVHADFEALDAALAWLDGQGIGTVLCTGDIVNGPGDANACCSLLRVRAIPSVRGNHDRWLVNRQMLDLPDATHLESIESDNLEWLSELPPTLDFRYQDLEILLCHGLRADDMAGVRSSDYGYALEANESLNSLITEARYHYVLCGHTHEALVRRFDHLTILNPGALYRPHGGDFAVVDFERREMRLLSCHSFAGISDLGPRRI
jgi:putative phosphoesterase